MASAYDWSVTAGNNSSADSGINWAEGQDPGTVNDSARQMMGRVAEILGDLGGALSAGGTANGLTVTANSAFTTLAEGRLISFRATASNSAAATLNVNGIGAKSIRKMTAAGDSAIGAGDIQNTGVYMAQYSAALNGAAGGWLLVNPTLSSLSLLDLTLTSTDAGATAGPVLTLYRNSASPLASDIIGKVLYQGEDSAGNTEDYAETYATITDPTSTSEDASYLIRTKVAGTMVTHATFGGAAGATFGPITATTISGSTITSSNGVFIATAGGITLRPNPGDANQDATIDGNGNMVVGGTVNATGNIETAANFNAGTYSGAGASAGVFIGASGVINLSSTGTGSHQKAGFVNANGGVGSIVTSGSATTYNTASDKRLKENFRDFDSDAILAQLVFGQFEWIGSGETGFGVLAQDAEPAFPAAISRDDSGRVYADYSKYMPVVANSLTKLIKRVAELEARTT